MATTAQFYNAFFTSACTGLFDLTTDTVMCALVSSSYTPDQASDTYWSTPQADEVTGTGYTAGGTQVSGITITTSGWSFTGDNVQWTGATLTAQYAVLYVKPSSTSAADASPLIAYVDFGSAISVSDQTLIIDWSSSGIGQITVAS